MSHLRIRLGYQGKISSVASCLYKQTRVAEWECGQQWSVGGEAQQTPTWERGDECSGGSSGWAVCILLGSWPRVALRAVILNLIWTYKMLRGAFKTYWCLVLIPQDSDWFNGVGSGCWDFFQSCPDVSNIKSKPIISALEVPPLTCLIIHVWF